MSNDAIKLTVISLYIKKKKGAVNIPVKSFQLIPEHGIVGNIPFGKTRVRSNGEVVPNIRHFTAVSPQELGRIAEELGVPYIDPAWIKANMCVSCPDIPKMTTTIVPGTKLLNAEGVAILEVTGMVEPCTVSGGYIAQQFPDLPVAANRFPKAAYQQRGIHGIALIETTIKQGDVLTAILP